MVKSELINNRSRAKQLLGFDGLQWGRCRPTDLDFSMDFNKKVFVFGELKGTGAPLTVGQRIHLEGLVDAIIAGGRAAVAFVAHHDTPDTEHDVNVAESMVTSSYNGQKWESFSTVTVKEYVDRVYQMHKSGAFG